MMAAFKRLATRMAILATLVIVAAIAIAEARHGRKEKEKDPTNAGGEPIAASGDAAQAPGTTPIPISADEEPAMVQPAPAAALAGVRMLPAEDEDASGYYDGPSRWEAPDSPAQVEPREPETTPVRTAAEPGPQTTEFTPYAPESGSYPPVQLTQAEARRDVDPFPRAQNPFRTASRTDSPSAGDAAAAEPPADESTDERNDDAGGAPPLLPPPPEGDSPGPATIGPQAYQPPAQRQLAETYPPDAEPRYGDPLPDNPDAGAPYPTPTDGPPPREAAGGFQALPEPSAQEPAAAGRFQAAPDDGGLDDGHPIRPVPPPAAAEPPATPPATAEPPIAVSPMGTSQSASSGAGRPGPREQAGPQTPTLTVEKIAPPEVQVGKSATFQIRVRNVGQVTASQVLVRDEVPDGTELVDATPAATRTTDGAILWQLGDLRPGDEMTVAMQLTPLREGEIGSVATVSFQASATASSTSTRPALEIELTGPRQVLVGQDVTFSIRLTNPGSGVATQVVLEDDVPPGLSHTAGQQLQYEVGTIRPGETRNLELTLKAAKPGMVENVIMARGDAGLVAQDQAQLEVIAPQLQVGLEGPTLRYLARQATFTVSVSNPGSAPANNIELVAQLPAGLKFVNTNNAGQYDSSAHTVRWSLAELPPGELGKVQVTATPTEMGQMKVRAEARADMNLSDVREHTLAVEGLTALFFSLRDLADPIEVGGQTTYEVRVLNQGTKTASNVQLVALLPPGMRAISGEGATRGAVEPQRVVFDTLARLAPQGEAAYTIHVEGAQAGDHRFRVQVTSDELTAPVTKEESTRVYSDQ